MGRFDDLEEKHNLDLSLDDVLHRISTTCFSKEENQDKILTYIGRIELDDNTSLQLKAHYFPTIARLKYLFYEDRSLDAVAALLELTHMATVIDIDEEGNMLGTRFQRFNPSDSKRIYQELEKRYNSK